jgi:hypothetical protein
LARYKSACRRSLSRGLLDLKLQCIALAAIRQDDAIWRQLQAAYHEQLVLTSRSMSRICAACQVPFVEWTDAGHLRHFTFLAMRDDKRPAEVVRETDVLLIDPSFGAQHNCLEPRL